MGNISSLTILQLAELQRQTSFTEREIKRIHRRFSKLDKMEKGYVNFYDLLNIMDEQENSQFLEKLVKTLSNSNYDPEIDFRRFIKLLDAFKRNDEEKKIQFLFEMYDFDEDGLVNKKDLNSFFTLLVGEDIPQDQLEQMIDLMFKQADANQDNKLDINEFRTLITPQGQKS